MDNFIYGCIEGSYAQGMQTENSDLDIIEVYNAAIHMEKELKKVNDIKLNWLNASRQILVEFSPYSLYISAGEPRLHGLLAPPSRREPHTAGRLSSPHRFCRQSQLPESNFCVSMAMTRLGCSVSPLTVMSLVTSTRACEKISRVSIDNSSCGEKLSRQPISPATVISLHPPQQPLSPDFSARDAPASRWRHQ